LFGRYGFAKINDLDDSQEQTLGKQMTSPSQADLGGLKAPFVNKLARFVDLSPRERDHLQAIQGEFVKLRAGIDIITAGQTYRSIFVLSRGMAIRYKVLHDGRRQILNLVLPGDFIGFPGALFEHSLYSVAGLTEIVVCPVSFSTVFDLMRRYPKLGAALFWLVGHEAALFAEHLVGVGRQSAYERVAHLLLELLVRLQIAGLADERSFYMPLTVPTKYYIRQYS
jgi:CRP-like cAMP-binding protein